MRIFFISSKSFLRLSRENIFGDDAITEDFSFIKVIGLSPFGPNDRLHNTMGVIIISINRYFFITIHIIYCLRTLKKAKGYKLSREMLSLTWIFS